MQFLRFYFFRFGNVDLGKCYYNVIKVWGSFMSLIMLDFDVFVKEINGVLASVGVLAQNVFGFWF